MTDALLTFLLAVTAALFACVGQAGGAGYVAILGLFGFDPTTIKVTALFLTLLVAAIGVARFQMAGVLRTRDWYPFALLGIPCSLIGGAITIPGHIYPRILSVLLLAAGVQMIRRAFSRSAEIEDQDATPHKVPAILVGGIVGLMAGITGIGGGIFLVPLILWRQWAGVRKASAIAQVNNLYTAAAAIVGQLAIHHVIPQQLPAWSIAAALGGAFGAWLGVRHLPTAAMRALLGLALVVSALKLAAG